MDITVQHSMTLAALPWIGGAMIVIGISVLAFWWLARDMRCTVSDSQGREYEHVGGGRFIAKLDDGSLLLVSIQDNCRR